MPHGRPKWQQQAVNLVNSVLRYSLPAMSRGVTSTDIYQWLRGLWVQHSFISSCGIYNPSVVVSLTGLVLASAAGGD